MAGEGAFADSDAAKRAERAYAAAGHGHSGERLASQRGWLGGGHVQCGENGTVHLGRGGAGSDPCPENLNLSRRRLRFLARRHEGFLMAGDQVGEARVCGVAGHDGFAAVAAGY